MVLKGNFPPDARVRKEAKALIGSGHEIRLLCRGEEPKEQNIGGLSVRKIVHKRWEKTDLFNLKNLYGITRKILLFVDARWERELHTELSNNDFDMIHVHDLPLARTVLKVSEKPIILDLHENYKEAVKQYRKSSKTDPLVRRIAKKLFWPTWRYRKLQKESISNSEHVLAVTPEAREDYIDSGADPSKVTVISNTVDLEWFDKCLNNSEISQSKGTTLTYVGTLSGTHRGIDILIRAIPKIINKIPKVKLRIAGGGKEEPHLKQLADDIGVKNHVEFTGWVEEKTIPNYIASADIGVIPHRTNTHTNTTVPHKLFQYMAAGIPVLATNTKPVKRIIEETKAGLITKSDDPDQMAKGAIKLIKSNLEEIGLNGRKAVEEKYNWNRDAEKLREVYSRIEKRIYLS